MPAVAAHLESAGHAAVTDAARVVLARVRQEIAAGRLDENGVALALDGLEDAIGRELRRLMQASLRRVINATGVVLHTNLGRAPLAESALDHVRSIAGGFSNLEYQVNSGERGKRDVHVQRLFAQLLGHDAGSAGEAERSSTVSTVVVNNNAAAVLLALNTLAEGGEVIVSRGELVEIGGSFRVPEVMAKSGAVLREVGTTNRTRVSDYTNAINERTRLLLRVHRSNFEIVGFTEQASLDELVRVGRDRGLPVMEDLGSGALLDLRTVGIAGEQGVANSLRAGVDVVTYSGDKLLGGPQAGILSGRPDLIARIRQNPLFRALRVDKLTYAALEATLLAYLRQDYDAVPALRMMRLSAAEIGARAEAIAGQVRALPPATAGRAHLRIEVCDGESVTGGGAAPAATLPTRLLALTSEHSADDLAAQLRTNDPPIVARVEDGRVLLDLRTVFPAQDDLIVAALRGIAK